MYHYGYGGVVRVTDSDLASPWSCATTIAAHTRWKKFTRPTQTWVAASLMPDCSHEPDRDC